MRPLILAGPTSAGKTAAALAVAERFDAVVLSVDAMQVYRGMDVGTGKATAEERARVEHFGLDLVEPHQPFDATDFVRHADEVLASHPRVVLAGGTSLYLRGVLRGFVQTPPVDPAFRAELEASDALHERLMAVDPALAARLHPNDKVRLIRGLEVYHSSGERLSDLQNAHAQAPPRVDATCFWLDRDGLDARIDARVHAMIAAGYVAEVEGLLARGVHRGLKPMRSLGYRHLCDHLLDGLPLAEAVRRTQRDTRRFARKQRTWQNVLGFSPVDATAFEPVIRAAEAMWRAAPPSAAG